jgi:hypothetical protein
MTAYSRRIRASSPGSRSTAVVGVLCRPAMRTYPPLLAVVGTALVLTASVWLHPPTRRSVSRSALALGAAGGTVRRDPLTILQVCALQVLAQLVVLVGLLGALLATGTHVPYLAVLTLALLTTALIRN